MRTRPGRLAVPACVLAACLSTSTAHAHAPGISLSGFGTATVDGVLSPGEWDGAAHVDFNVNVPAADGGGTTPATLYVMNDETNLFLAVQLKRSSFGGATNPSFEFDNDHDGVREAGDDVFGMAVGIFQAAELRDAYFYRCPWAPPDTAGCSALDHTDGTTAATNDGTYTYVEVSHPLDSGDIGHDLSLQPGDTVGFNVLLRLFALVPSTYSYADTGFPTCDYCAGLFGDIVVAGAGPIPVAIDIKPGSPVNPINPRSAGRIPVAILSSPEFDAPLRVDARFLRFGHTGDETSLESCSPGPEDVNADGLADLICHFATRRAGFRPGDKQGFLKGRTVDGQAFEGHDSVRIVGRREPSLP
jgi:hypothetical protein